MISSRPLPSQLQMKVTRSNVQSPRFGAVPLGSAKGHRPSIEDLDHPKTYDTIHQIPSKPSTWQFVKKRGWFAPLLLPVVSLKLLGVKKTAKLLVGRSGGFEPLLQELLHKLLYSPPKDGAAYHKLMQQAHPAMQEMDIPVAKDGVNIKGWYIAPKQGMPTLLFAPGKQGHSGKEGLGLTLKFIEAAEKAGYGLMTFDYRGYGKSEGTLGEQQFYDDLRATSDFLAQKLNTPLTDQIAFGYSMGGAVVAEVAQERPFKGVVLCCTFTNPLDTVPSLQKYLKIPRFVPMKKWARRFTDVRMDSISKIPQFKSPTLILHGKGDKRVPYEQAQQLFNALPEGIQKDIKLYEDKSHSGIFDVSEEMIGEVSRFFSVNR